MSDFNIPAETVCYEQGIKKSRFIAYAAHASSPDAANIFIKKIRSEYPDARHVCWAYVAGQPGHTTHVGFSDDGEPNGTAGMPMLNVLQHGETGEIVVVVVRYFGGIKLGAGGLARAYSSSVTGVLKILPLQLKVTMISVVFNVEFSLEDPVRRSLQAAGVENIKIQYNESLSIECDVPEDHFIDLKKNLNDISRGKVDLKNE